MDSTSHRDEVRPSYCDLCGATDHRERNHEPIPPNETAPLDLRPVPGARLGPTRCRITRKADVKGFVMTFNVSEVRRTPVTRRRSPAASLRSSPYDDAQSALFERDRSARRLLRVADVAEMIGCSTKAVRHRLARGQLPGVTRIGGSVYLRRDDVLRFLAEGRGSSPKRSR